MAPASGVGWTHSAWSEGPLQEKLYSFMLEIVIFLGMCHAGGGLLPPSKFATWRLCTKRPGRFAHSNNCSPVQPISKFHHPGMSKGSVFAFYPSHTTQPNLP